MGSMWPQSRPAFPRDSGAMGTRSPNLQRAASSASVVSKREAAPPQGGGGGGRGGEGGVWSWRRGWGRGLHGEGEAICGARWEMSQLSVWHIMRMFVAFQMERIRVKGFLFTARAVRRSARTGLQYLSTVSVRITEETTVFCSNFCPSGNAKCCQVFSANANSPTTICDIIA